MAKMSEGNKFQLHLCGCRWWIFTWTASIHRQACALNQWEKRINTSPEQQLTLQIFTACKVKLLKFNWPGIIWGHSDLHVLHRQSAAGLFSGNYLSHFRNYRALAWDCALAKFFPLIYSLSTWKGTAIRDLFARYFFPPLLFQVAFKMPDLDLNKHTHLAMATQCFSCKGED